MKKTFAIVTILAFLLICNACNKISEKTTDTNESSVDTILIEINDSAQTESLLENDVDYDLTSMSSDMIYATVYQMMIDPDAFIGKTVCISGQYYALYYDETEQYYHYCIISDATACCSQGLEFIWDDGNHLYPDEYPKDYTEIVVIGTFGTYEELDYLYCCLCDASMKILE